MKKYLIFDNIVRGAGLGHTLVNYNHGLNYCIKHDLIWTPHKIIPGHCLNACGHTLEAELGLPQFSKEHIDNIRNTKNFEEIKLSTPECCIDWSLTRPVFKNWYAAAREGKKPMFLSESKTNICVSIRRGDLAGKPNHSMFWRLQPFSYYTEQLKELIKKESIEQYRLIISTDLHGHDNCIVDRHNNPHDIRDIFRDFSDDLIFVPFREDKPESNKYHTYDFLHAAISSDFFIGDSQGGYSVVIREIYRHGG